MPSITGAHGWRWIALAVIALAGCALVAEAGGILYFRVREAGPAEAALPALPSGSTPPLPISRFHPYLGFAVRADVPIARFVRHRDMLRAVLDGSPDREEPPDWLNSRSNNFGFFSPWDYPMDAPDAFVVGIFGGSVAEGFALLGGDRLAAGLGAQTGFEGRWVLVLNFGMGGYKQPQQLLLLAYLLTVGQRLDAIVNIDGFNEAALGTKNVRAGVDISMPSIHHMDGPEVMARSGVDPAATGYLFALHTLRERIQSLRGARDETISAARAMWADLALSRALAEYRELAVSPPAPKEGPTGRVVALAPARVAVADGESVAKEIAEQWSRASIAMAQLARANGAHYLHLLQPNQYATERRFTEAERRIAFSEASPYREGVRAVYPALGRRTAALKEAGVDFHDARGIFDAVAAPVYSDNCCHYNQRGNDILADFIVARLLAASARDGGGAAETQRPTSEGRR